MHFPSHLCVPDAPPISSLFTYPIKCMYFTFIKLSIRVEYTETTVIMITTDIWNIIQSINRNAP